MTIYEINDESDDETCYRIGLFDSLEKCHEFMWPIEDPAGVSPNEGNDCYIFTIREVIVNTQQCFGVGKICSTYKFENDYDENDEPVWKRTREDMP